MKYATPYDYAANRWFESPTHFCDSCTADFSNDGLCPECEIPVEAKPDEPRERSYDEMLADSLAASERLEQARQIKRGW